MTSSNLGRLQNIGYVPGGLNRCRQNQSSGTRVFVFAVWSFLLLGRLKTSQADRAHRPNSKKKTPPPKQPKKRCTRPKHAPGQNKKHAHPPKQQKRKHARKGRGRVYFFCCLGVVFCFLFFAVWAGPAPAPKQQKKTRTHPNSKK